MKEKKYIFSGIQPSGAIHLGNYFGAIRQWVELQKTYTGIFSIVDYHAITVNYDPHKLQRRILEAAADYLAAGIDPKKSMIFVQSDVPEHVELAWLFNTILPVSELRRMTQYKEKSGRQQSASAGLLNYPILMAADILLYKAIGVPVGEDQIQHVELTRTIARNFNRKFGKVFVEPSVILSRGSRIMSLADPLKKMSKSLGEKHYVALSDSPSVMRKKFMSAVTDTGVTMYEKKKSPGVYNLFELLELMTDAQTVARFEKKYQTGNLSYKELKETLGNAAVDMFASFQEKRTKLLSDEKKLRKILADGASRARKIAQKTLQEAKQKMGIAK
ncbi:MAG: tryptophan--tRNA ligase [Patescibacteria group bacterium]|jgi:tryptophanyl-tRNA synthetase